MTYPPGSPGYPPAPQPSSQYGAPQPQFAKTSDASAGDNKLPVYLLAAVAVLGLITYLVSYGPLYNLGDGLPLAGGWGIDGSLLAGLLAAVALLPKQKNWTAITAVVATFAFLQVIFAVVKAMDIIDWGYYVVLAVTLFQAGAAVAALLFDSGVIAPPAPKPVYEQQQPQYGQYGGPTQYYGQHSQPQHGGQPYQQAQQTQPHQRPGYPSQYGGYQGGPSSGGYQGPQGGPQSGPPTPPTGFPAYGQPRQQSDSSSSSSSSSSTGSSGSSAPTTQVPAQPQAQQSSSSQQSGPASS